MLVKKHRYVSILLTGFFLVSLACVSFSVNCTWLIDHCLTPQSGVPRLLAGAFITASALVLLLSIWRTRCYARQLMTAALDLPAALQTLIQDLGVDQRAVVLVGSSEPLVFCFGFLRPRICISTALVDWLSSTQLSAALLHEDYHRQQLDPLRITLVDAFATVLFFLPVVAEWAVYFKTGRELAADAYAVTRVGRAALAGALHRLLLMSSSSTTREAGIALTAMSTNAARLAALLGEHYAMQPVSSRSLLHSTTAVWLFCLLLVIFVD